MDLYDTDLIAYRENVLASTVPVTPFQFPRIIASMIVCFGAYGQIGGIVGGAVRDHILNKPIKDFDMYMQTDAKDHYQAKFDINEVKIHCDRFGYTMKDITIESAYDTNGIVAVLQLTHQEEVQPVEVILGRQTIEEYISYFTISLSKCWYNVLKGDFRLRPDFYKSVEDKKVIIYNRQGLQSMTIEAYVNRIAAKYPEYTFSNYILPELEGLDVPF